jgi:hypothetical protein
MRWLSLNLSLSCGAGVLLCTSAVWAQTDSAPSPTSEGTHSPAAGSRAAGTVAAPLPSPSQRPLSAERASIRSEPPVESNPLPPSSESPAATAEFPASASTSPAHGSDSEPDDQGPGTPTFGGLGYGAVGVMAGSVTGASAHLERALGADGVPGGLGWQLGGGGKALLWGLVIGGKGFFLAYPETSTARGSSLLRGGGGGFDLGYAVVNRSDRIVCPFVGIGGIGFDLSVANISDEAMLLGSEEIEPNEDATFSGGFW